MSSRSLYVLADHSPEKPRKGEPCSGCGICCAAETCLLARTFLHAEVAPCPAMEFDDGRFWCGLVRNPLKYLPVAWATEKAELLGELFSDALGLGMGCDADDPTPSQMPRLRRRSAAARPAGPEVPRA